jgi:hypothetical protein
VTKTHKLSVGALVVALGCVAEVSQTLATQQTGALPSTSVSAVPSPLSISGSSGLYQAFTSPQAAGAAVGITVAVPSWSPEAWTGTVSDLVTDRSMTVTVNLAALEQEFLALLKLINPGGGSVSPNPSTPSVTVDAVSLVQVVYQSSSDYVIFAQAPSTDVVVPWGVNLPLLAELRFLLMGFSLKDAAKFANAVDWRTAMLVAVPQNIASMSSVKVGGNAAVLIAESPNGIRPPANVVVWSAGGTLYGMRGTISGTNLLAMAQSVH